MRNENEVVKGSRWQHFKGDVMEVLCVASHSENLEKMVVYEHGGNCGLGLCRVFYQTKTLVKEKIIRQVRNLDLKRYLN